MKSIIQYLPKGIVEVDEMVVAHHEEDVVGHVNKKRKLVLVGS